MAVVYLAQDRKHHRPVAIKVLRPELAAALGPERFLREIEIAARLQHPNIVPLYDSGDANGTLYYVMPFVAGESLRARLDREKQLPIEDALQIVREAGEALAHAHSYGMVHRDVKPDNILLSAGHAVVTDFGIARAISAAAGDRLTATGITVGTPRYMSPEQAAGSTDLDGRSDLYSLGCVLYEMLAGQTPFTGPTAETVLHQHLTADPAPVNQLRPTVPAGVVGVLGRALAKSPADRYATAAQFVASLGEALRLPPSVARRRSRRGIAAGVAAAAAVMLGVGYLAFRGQPAAGAVLPAASTIAVMPVAPVVPDTALERLGRELVVTLSANLDGVGGIRTVDAITVLAQVPPGKVVTGEGGAELARRLGARSMLEGSIVREGTNVRLDIALLDVDSLAPIARATVTSPAVDIASLSDSAALAVLTQVWRRGRPPVPDLAALTTRSVPALRAYLEGEQALARAEFPEAVRDFDRAFAADSHFWFAFWRSLYPRVYEGTRPADSATVAELIRHRRDLPEADRLLIEAGYLGKSMSEELALLRETTRRFPNYWPAWYEYANFLVHWTPYVGTTQEDARVALERVVQLNPRFAPGWEHLLWIAIFQRDTARVTQALGVLEGFVTGTDYRFTPVFINYYRALKRLSDAGGRYAAADLAQDAHYLVATFGASADEFPAVSLLIYGFPRAQVELNDAVLALKPNPRFQGAMWEGNGFAYAARGAWDSAVVAIERWQRLADDSVAPLATYGLAVAGTRLGAVQPRRAAGLRPGRTPTWPEGRAELAWLDGIVAHGRGDAAGLARARQQVRESGCAYADLLDRSLAGFAAELAGNGRAAARALAALEWESAERTRHHDYGRHHPYFNSVNRLAATRWLLDAGDTAQAVRLLTWHQAVFWRVHQLLGPANHAAAAPALFQLAQLEDASGDTAGAVTHYRAFLRYYDTPSGEWVRRVEEARVRLQRLNSQR